MNPVSLLCCVSACPALTEANSGRDFLNPVGDWWQAMNPQGFSFVFVYGPLSTGVRQGIPKKSKPLHKDYRSQFKGWFRDQTGATKSRLCSTQQLGRNVRPKSPHLPSRVADVFSVVE